MYEKRTYTIVFVSPCGLQIRFGAMTIAIFCGVILFTSWFFVSTAKNLIKKRKFSRFAGGNLYNTSQRARNLMPIFEIFAAAIHSGYNLGNHRYSHIAFTVTIIDILIECNTYLYVNRGSGNSRKYDFNAPAITCGSLYSRAVVKVRQQASRLNLILRDFEAAPAILKRPSSSIPRRSSADTHSCMGSAIFLFVTLRCSSRGYP